MGVFALVFEGWKAHFTKEEYMIKNFTLLIFLVLLVSFTGRADVIKVNNLYVETEKLVNTNRGYYVPKGSAPKYNFNVGMNFIDGLGIIYLDNEISSTVDQSQFRYVALDNELGINTTIGIQIYYRHYSGHMLDAVNADRFPEENVIGLRFNIIGD